MKAIDDKIREHYKKSKDLRNIDLDRKKVPFEKGREIQAQQNEEWQKFLFFRNLRKEMVKNEKTNK